MKVKSYDSGDVLDGVASEELIRESAAESSGTGAVPAYRDDFGTWQYVQPSRVSFVERWQDRRVVIVYVED